MEAFKKCLKIVKRLYKLVHVSDLEYADCLFMFYSIE